MAFPNNIEVDPETGEVTKELDDPDLLQNRPALQRALVISGAIATMTLTLTLTLTLTPTLTLILTPTLTLTLTLTPTLILGCCGRT